MSLTRVRRSRIRCRPRLICSFGSVVLARNVVLRLLSLLISVLRCLGLVAGVLFRLRRCVVDVRRFDRVLVVLPIVACYVLTVGIRGTVCWRVLRVACYDRIRS